MPRRCEREGRGGGRGEGVPKGPGFSPHTPRPLFVTWPKFKLCRDHPPQVPRWALSPHTLPPRTPPFLTPPSPHNFSVLNWSAIHLAAAATISLGKENL